MIFGSYMHLKGLELGPVKGLGVQGLRLQALGFTV